MGGVDWVFPRILSQVYDVKTKVGLIIEQIKRSTSKMKMIPKFQNVALEKTEYFQVHTILLSKSCF